MKQKTYVNNFSTRLSRSLAVFVAGLFVATVTPQASVPLSPSLVVGSSQALSGTSGLLIPVTLTNNGSPAIAAMMVDVSFDATRLQFRSAQISAAAQAEGKLLVSSVPTANRIRLIVYGDQAVIADASVAELTFDVLSNAAAGAAALTMVEAAASDATGRPVPMSLQSGSIVVLVNQPPFVSVGTTQTITLPSAATLDGTVTDDGLPNPPSRVTAMWTKDSGPGIVTFADAASADTTAAFSIEGTYVLRLTATDGALSNSDITTIVVRPAPDAIAPVITITEPADGALVNAPSLQIRGTIVDAGSGVASARLNGQALTLGAGGAFQQLVTLQEGRNTLTVSATDTAGNTGTASVRVTLDTLPPVPAILSPADRKSVV